MKKSIVFFLWLALSSLVRGQGIVVQNSGNLCFANHELIQSLMYQKFKTQEVHFDTIHTFPNTACFLSNTHNKLFLAYNNGTNASPSFSFITSIYYHPFLYKGNSVSGRFNNDNLTDYAVINAFGDIVALKNTGYPLPFDKDSMGNSFIVGHVNSKLLKCNLDGSGYQDLVSFGIKVLGTQSFVVRPYINSTPAATTASLSFNPQGLRTITNMTSNTNYNYDVEVADLDKNGKDELIFTSEVLDSIYVIYSFAGILDKQFQFGPGLGITLKKVVVSDLNGDGNKEIIVSAKTNSNGINYVSVFTPIYSSGIITGFNSYNPVIANYEISDFDYADVNADGYKDLVVSPVTPSVSTSGSIKIYLHDRTSTSFQFSNTPISFGVLNHRTEGIAICDVDDNKRPDIISFNQSDTSSMVILKNFTYRDTLLATPNKTTICLGETITLKNQLIGFPGVYFTNIVPSLSLSPSFNHTAVISSPGNYVVNASFNPYVGGTCAFSSNSILIQPGIQPNLSVTGPSTVCYNTPITLNAAGASSYTWTSSSGTLNASVFPLTPTTTVVYLLSGSSIHGCRANLNGTLNVKPEVVATITHDKNFLCKNQSAKLTASGGSLYTWSTGESSPTIIITQTSNIAQGYNVNVIRADGCSNTATFSTNFNDKCKEVTVIKGITPNSGGGNDKLFIENIENYPENVVSIYNRWGVMLYSQKGYDNSTKFWPEKSSGNLVSGTYYYVVDLGEGNEVKKGWIEIFSN